MATQQKNRIHPHKFTLYVAIASILMMFAGLTSAFIVKSSQPGWVTIEMPPAFWYSTVAILLSSLTIQMALRAFKQRNMMQYRALMLTTLGLGIAFVILQYIGFSWLWEHGVQWKGAGEGQFLYIIAGLHGLHVMGGIVALLVMMLQAFFARTRNYNSVPVEVMSTYWHFVDILWIYLLVFFIYIG
ncbi:MAG TPA: cytochrome c oxidase subunit 3 [Chitinophagaceae bacterium]|nr:cytochrome c oxidase subunit 3 [Chitinophagaceae bacterium]